MNLEVIGLELDDYLSGEDPSFFADRGGPCEDDCESACPYISIMPEESEHENGSPIRL